VRGWGTREESAEGADTELSLDDGRLVATLRTTKLHRGERVAWRCVGGPADWIGTEVSVNVAPDGDATVVRLSHHNWREASDAFGDSSATWARFLFHIKSTLEIPDPDDVQL
jgi:hypothetical protein